MTEEEARKIIKLVVCYQKQYSNKIEEIYLPSMSEYIVAQNAYISELKYGDYAPASKHPYKFNIKPQLVVRDIYNTIHVLYPEFFLKVEFVSNPDISINK